MESVREEKQIRIWHFAISRSRYRWSLSDSLSHINERIGPMTVQEEGIAGGESAKGGKADETTAQWGDKERSKVWKMSK